MNRLTDPIYLRNLLKRYQFKPKDYLGQNFLVDEEILQKIIKAADLKTDDVVLEVGPGLGVLTVEIAKRVKRVVGVEKDRRVVSLLKKEFSFLKNLEIIEGDILKFYIAKYIKEKYKVVANIPYYLTSHLIQSFLNSEVKPEVMVLMVQKEVAQRIVAKPGKLSILGISVQINSKPEIIDLVPKESFWPSPKVNSAIIKIVPANIFPVIKDKKLFFRIIKSAFASKRKQLHNSLTAGLNLSKAEVLNIFNQAGIKQTSRPQDLSLKNWVDL